MLDVRIFQHVVNLYAIHKGRSVRDNPFADRPFLLFGRFHIVVGAGISFSFAIFELYHLTIILIKKPTPRKQIGNTE